MRAILLAGGASLRGGGAFDRSEYYPMAPQAVESRATDFGDTQDDGRLGQENLRGEGALIP